MTDRLDADPKDSPEHPGTTTTQQNNSDNPGSPPSSHREEYPTWIGQKFERDGTVLPFPGNTIICNLSIYSDLYTGLLSLYNDIQKQPFAPLYVLLPPSSWHMTLSEGVCDQIRNRESWPGELLVESSLQECNEFMRQKFADFDLDWDPPFRMSFVGWEPLEDGIALKVVPATDDEEVKLRGLRDRLAQRLGMWHPRHKKYVFHISMAYTLRYLTEVESKATMVFLEAWRARLPKYFELDAPNFCRFDDMFAFQKVLSLGRTP